MRRWVVRNEGIYYWYSVALSADESIKKFLGPNHKPLELAVWNWFEDNGHDCIEIEIKEICGNL